MFNESSRDTHTNELCEAINRWCKSHNDNPTPTDLIITLEAIGWMDVEMMISDALESGCVIKKGGKLFVKGDAV